MGLKYFFKFLKTTPNECYLLQPTHAAVRIIIMKWCVWTVGLVVAYRPVFVSELNFAYVRHHEACVSLLARFPGANGHTTLKTPVLV